MSLRVSIRTAAFFAAAALLAGCAAFHQEKPDYHVQAQGVDNDQVAISAPTLEIDGNAITVSGVVNRKPGVTDPVMGRVDIIAIGPDGGSLFWLPALLTPKSVPAAGHGTSDYIAHYGYVPPPGSTIYVRFVDSDTATQEDIDGTEKNATRGLRGAAGAFRDQNKRPFIGW